MQAFEFSAKESRGMIKIPKEYLAMIKGGNCKVILLVDKAMSKVEPKKRSFKAIKIKTKGFKFNRDEANER